VSSIECVGSASAAAFSSAASESFTTPLALSNINNWSMPADPGTLRRLLASEEVRMPFFTSRSSRVEFAALPMLGLAPLAGAAVALAPVGPAVVAELVSAAHSAAGANRHPTTARTAIANRKESRILASAMRVGAIRAQRLPPGDTGTETGVPPGIGPQRKSTRRGDSGKRTCLT